MIQMYTSRKINGTWQIVRISGEPVDVAPQFDIVVAPMLGFDNSLHRIGYGGGYYDQFLSSQHKAQKIGLCFEQGRQSNLPVEDHDIALDSIVTEAWEPLGVRI